MIKAIPVLLALLSGLASQPAAMAQTTAASPSGELERFRAKARPALDAGWKPVRVKKTRQIKGVEPSFRFDRNRKGSSRLLKKSLNGVR